LLSLITVLVCRIYNYLYLNNSNYTNAVNDSYVIWDLDLYFIVTLEDGINNSKITGARLGNLMEYDMCKLLHLCDIRLFKKLLVP
jgi:hypothetical protein